MIITIARQCGCGAVRVGRLLAEHYGIPFYTRKNLMEMAEEPWMRWKLSSMKILLTNCSFQCLPWVRIKDYSQKNLFVSWLI